MSEQKMTEGVDLPDFFTSEPGQIADLVYNAVQSRKDVVYFSGGGGW